MMFTPKMRAHAVPVTGLVCAQVLLLAGLATASSAQFVGFTPRTDYPLPAGSLPTDSVLVDLDNDGDLDIAVTCFGGGSLDFIAILLNNGDGTFGAATTTSVGDSPSAIAAADMDNDGNADLLCANRDTDDFSVRLGNGDGTFGPEIFRGVGTRPQGIATADFDRDGLLDVVVCNESDNNVSVCFGNGDGTTGPATLWTTNSGGGTGGIGPRDVIAADFNFDGNPDIVTANLGSDTVSILYNVEAAPGNFFSGDFGLFAAAGNNPVTLETDDLGPDGDPDLIIATTAGEVITRFNETSEGPVAFPVFPSSTSRNVGGRPVGLAIADFDNLEIDGDDDIIVADEVNNRITVLINTGNAIYTNAGTFPTAQSPQDPSAADLDGDGDHDVVVPHYGAASVGVFLNANTIVGGAAPGVDIVSPDEAQCVCGGTVSIIADIDAAPGTIADTYTLAYRRFGDAAYTAIASGSGEFSGAVAGTWDTSGLSEGYYILRLTARNSGGISASDEVAVFLSKSISEVSAHLASGLNTTGAVGSAEIVGRTVCVFGTVEDNACGPITYRVDYRPASGGDFVPVDPASPTYTGSRSNEVLATLETTGLPDGDYVIRVEGQNGCGQGSSATVPFTVDNTAPIGVVETPENCGFFAPSGGVTITGTASDANLTGWSLQYTGGPTNGWVTIATGNTGITNDVLAVWDTSGLPPCAYTIRLSVGDASILNCGTGGHSALYLTSINLGCRADLAAPYNVLDLTDITTFIESFTAGCP